MRVNTKRKSARRQTVHEGDINSYFMRPEGERYSSKVMSARLSEPDPNDDCPITQEKIKDAYLDFLPGETVHTDFPDLKKMTLECQHSFSALPLLYHFLTNGMLCPLCRKGFPETISHACLPDHVRGRMTTHASEVHIRHQQESARDDLQTAMMISRGEVEAVLMFEPSIRELMDNHPLTLCIFAHSSDNINETRCLFSFPLNATLQPPPLHTGNLVAPESFFPYLVATLPQASIRETQRLLNCVSYIHKFTFVISVRDALNNTLSVVRSPIIDISQQENRAGLFHGQRHSLERGHLELSMLTGNGGLHQIEKISWVIEEETAQVLLSDLVFHRVAATFFLDGITSASDRFELN